MLTSALEKVRKGLAAKTGQFGVSKQSFDQCRALLYSQARTMTTDADVPSAKLTIDTISPHVKKAEYAVRGDIVVRAGQISKELKSGKKFPFEDVVMCNIGNPQSLGQKPITFYRQVLAICDYPQVRLRSVASYAARRRSYRPLT